MNVVSRTKKRILALLLVMAVVIGVMPGINVSAAGFKGKGTKGDPYLVETAQQLQAMNDNLSAHYKLANTIDLSSVANFKPIGSLGKPFKGSFTCDTDADGTPKYAIKNLKVYNDAGEKYGHKFWNNNYPDYKESGSNWEAALFGAAEGSTFKNIALLNVDITNTVIGQNRMNHDWSLNPGQDEMGTGSLLACGKNVTITNCSATGKINAKTNGTGGLVGRADYTTIEKSYSAVEVTSAGYWGVGGFLGTGSKTTIRNCYSTGNVKNSAAGKDAASQGGFMGSVTGTFENCYSTGSIDYCFAFHYSQEYVMKNCVASGQSSGNAYTGKAGDVSASATNCLIVGANTYQPDFKSASKAEVQAVIDSVNKNISVIRDTSKYVPGAVTSDGTETTTTPTTDVGNETPQEDQVVSKTAEEMGTLIKDLNKKVFTGDITWEETLQAVQIKEDYLNMTDEERTKMDDLTVSMMNELYDKSVILVVTEMTEKIQALPSAKKVTAENAQKVLKVWKQYNELPESVQGQLAKDDVKKLKECYKQAEPYENVTIVMQEVDAGLSSLQNSILIGLIVINGLGLAAVIVLGIFVIKKLTNKKKKELGEKPNE